MEADVAPFTPLTDNAGQAALAAPHNPMKSTIIRSEDKTRRPETLALSGSQNSAGPSAQSGSYTSTHGS